MVFNPCVLTLRALQQASELRNVQRKLGCSRASLGSLSEAIRYNHVRNLLSPWKVLSRVTAFISTSCVTSSASCGWKTIRTAML